MIANLLLSFPADLSCSLLIQWIELKDFVSVDSAHCCISGWRSLCQSPLLVLPHDLKRMKSKAEETAESHFGQWLLSRNIRASTFVIYPSMQMKECESYLESFGDHVRQIKMVKLTNTVTDSAKISSTKFILLLSALPSLHTIHIENCSLDTTIFDVLPDCTALRELHMWKCLQPKTKNPPIEMSSSRRIYLTRLTANCSSALMARILTICDPACLERLSMTVTSNNRSDYGKDFLASPYLVLKQMLPLCIRLVGLEFAGVEIEDEDFIVLIDLCPQLQHLSVVGEYWVTDYSMVYVCQFQTELKTLNIAYTSCTDAILEPLILHRASQMKGLFVKASRVTVEGVRATLQACKNLTSLGFQFSFSGDSAALISTIAKHGNNLQKVYLHHYDVKHFDFGTLPVNTFLALTVLNIEHDGFEPREAHDPPSASNESYGLDGDEDEEAQGFEYLSDPESVHIDDSSESTLVEVEKEEKELKWVPVWPQNYSLRAWSAARPVVQVQENVRKVYYDLHAMTL